MGSRVGLIFCLPHKPIQIGSVRDIPDFRKHRPCSIAAGLCAGGLFDWISSMEVILAQITACVGGGSAARVITASLSVNFPLGYLSRYLTRS